MRSLFGILALVCSSCSPTVFVVDEAGRPIEDAKVIPMSRSFNWPPKETDENGGVLVHQDLPTIDYLQISKAGYRNHPLVNFNLPKPITVVLKK
ncbi:hypothetical protein N9013_03525 [Akkermansiaceae bacterium]|nr:hypothetical protein [Akkermansiaceae bacterium]